VLPPGASSLVRGSLPFGSAEFARQDALDITPASIPRAQDPIAGWRVEGSLAPSQRFLLRLPQRWNGRLVVAGTPGQRTEYASDLFFADPLLARGYAYVSSNKGQGEGGVLLAPGAVLEVEGAVLPRLALPGGLGVSLWQHAPGHTLERWTDDFIDITIAARELIATLHGREPEATYAVGLSNGGYQVRRAIERSDLFAGALAWNAVLWTPLANILTYLPPAIEALERGELAAVQRLGLPPDVRSTAGDSLTLRYLTSYFYAAVWLHATQLDPETSIAYGDTSDPTAAESWSTRIGGWRLDRSPRIAERIGRFSNTGALRCKLIDLASEFDYLIPPALNFFPYGALVASAGAAQRYRAELLPAAQHVDTWSDEPAYPQLRTGYQRVWAAFDELVAWVE
jgi:hypothetical protein